MYFVKRCMSSLSCVVCVCMKVIERTDFVYRATTEEWSPRSIQIGLHEKHGFINFHVDNANIKRILHFLHFPKTGEGFYFIFVFVLGFRKLFPRVLLVWEPWKFQIFIVDSCWLLLMLCKWIPKDRPSFVISFLLITHSFLKLALDLDWKLWTCVYKLWARHLWILLSPVLPKAVQLGEQQIEIRDNSLSAMINYQG